MDSTIGTIEIITQQMSKQEIDTYFTNNLSQIYKCINGVKYKTNRFNLETDVVVSECYMHIIKNQSKLKTESQLQAMIFNWCSQNIRWTNSKINKEDKITDTKNQPAEVESERDIIDLQKKEVIEEWYNSRMDILIQYRAQEKDKYSQIFFDCIFIKRIIKTKDLEAHIGIDQSGVAYYKKRLLKAIKTYLEQY